MTFGEEAKEEKEKLLEIESGEFSS